MIFTGLKITIIGMIMVFFFLILLIFIINIIELFCRRKTTEDIDYIQKNKEISNFNELNHSKLIVLISTAIDKFEEEIKELKKNGFKEN